MGVVRVVNVTSLVLWRTWEGCSFSGCCYRVVNVTSLVLWRTWEGCSCSCDVPLFVVGLAVESFVGCCWWVEVQRGVILQGWARVREKVRVCDFTCYFSVCGKVSCWLRVLLW